MISAVDFLARREFLVLFIASFSSIFFFRRIGLNILSSVFCYGDRYSAYSGESG